MPDKFTWPLFAAALIAGLLIGFAASTAAFRFRLLTVPGQGIVQRMNRELALSPAQRNQVGAVVEDTHDKIGDLRRQFRRGRHQAVWQAYGRIRALLTPEQQTKFDQLFMPPGVHRHRHHHH